VDLDATTRLAGWLVKQGVHGLYIAGTTGEGLYLSPEEHRELVRAVVNAAKGIPVVAHVGALTTAQAVGLARQAVQAGATAVAAIPPPYYSLSREELLTYFTAIAQAAAPLPLYLYNIPSHARNEVPPPFAADLGRAIPTLRGIKDSSGAPGRISDLVKTLGPDYDVVCGNDDKILQAFQVGAAGIVASGASVFPEMYLGLHTAWQAGRVAEAEEAQAKIVAMQQALGNGKRLGWYKYVLAQRGVPVGGVRGPLADATPAEQEAIQKSLKEMKLL
jgi:dihydrodipicolinate synthase/N-acetylneuraminate lyase